MPSRLAAAIRPVLQHSAPADCEVGMGSTASPNKAKPVPPWSILDRSKKWTPAVNTDVAATFRRIRAEMDARKGEAQ